MSNVKCQMSNVPERGIAALPVVVGVMLVVFIIVITALSIGFSELSISQRGAETKEGFYESSLGIEEMLIRLTRDPALSDTFLPTVDYSPYIQSLIDPQNTITVTLSTSLTQGDAEADCPELIVDLTQGDAVRIITSRVETKNQSAVVESKAVVKTDSQGKLTLCNKTIL